MPGCARPIAPYARLEPQSRGQRRGLLKIDARTREGRLLRDVRKTLLEHIGEDNATAVHKSLIERCAQLELCICVLDAKQARGEFTEHDGRVYLAMVGSLRRLYSTLGLERPTPKFSELMRKNAGKSTRANAAA